MTGPGCRSTATPPTWWPPSSLGPPGEARLVLPLTRRMGIVATLEQPGEPEVRAYPPEDALRRSRPLPSREDLVVTDVPDDQWAAFQEALAET